MSARVLMVQGTSSDVGKSLMVAALCRIYARRGLRVAPFKSQNMALNSFVTPEGHEIGRAQAVQAAAAGISPSVLMNPILLKPQSDTGCQVVLNGKAEASMSAVDYHAHKPALRATIGDALGKLRREYDLVIIEGAGSPVEMNLKEHDVANMFVAELCDAPVLLVADIDRGGVFASLVGTMELLEGSERARVRGFLINKFRGDPALLGDGLEILLSKTGVPVLGVVPYLRDLGVAEEDSVALAHRKTHFDEANRDTRKIAVVHFPHISNYDDVLPLEREAAVEVAFVRDVESIRCADLVVLPGSKSTVADLQWLREQGMAEALLQLAQAGRPIIGICGGCQMLGTRIEDPENVESSHPSVKGLGLLPFFTVFESAKITAQVRATAVRAGVLHDSTEIQGYEIHMGQLHWSGTPSPAFEISTRNGEEVHVPDGGVGNEGRIVGTMIHGIFGNAEVRKTLLSALGVRSGAGDSFFDSEIDRLADTVEGYVDVDHLDVIIGLESERLA